MLLLNRLTIRAKIVVAFALVLCCTVGLGLFAVQRLGAVRATTDEVRNNWLPSTRALGRVAQLAERTRSYQGLYFLAESEDERRARGAKTAKTVAELRAAFKEYEPFVLADEGKRLAGTMARAWSAYDTLSAQLADPTAERSEEGRERALSLFRGDMLTAMDAFRAAIQADLDYNVSEGRRVADQGNALGRSAHAWIITVLGAMVGLCALVGYSLIRGISGPITAMTAAMRRLADGDLAVEVPGVGRGDEVGAMADTVQVFKGNALHAREVEREQAEAQARRAAEDERVRAEAERAAATEAAALVVGSIGRGLERLAEGDLTHRLDAALPEAYEPLRANLNKAVEQLCELVGGIAANAHAIRSGTGEIDRLRTT